MKTATATRTGLLLIFLILGATMALGLGIRPAKTTIEAEYEKSFDGEVWVVNSDYQENSVTVSVEGEMAKYVTIHDSQIHFRSDDEAKAVHFSVRLPESIPPGISTAEIIVQATPGFNENQGMSSKIILKHQIMIHGPYPQKYVKTKINFHDRGEYIDFISEIENVGKEDINKVQTKFYVNDKEQVPLVLSTEEKSLEIKRGAIFELKVDKNDFDYGEYEVSAVTYYDGNQAEVIKTLIVGKPEIDITYFDQYLKANTINKYTLELLNKWNKRIENVFVNIILKRDENVLESFRTSPIDIPPLMRERIQEYLDTREYGPGEYNVELQVNYWNIYSMDSKSYDIELLKEKEQEQSTAPTQNVLVGNAIQAQETKLKSNMRIILLGSILLAVLVFGGYIIHRYRNRDDYEGGNNAF